MTKSQSYDSDSDKESFFDRLSNYSENNNGLFRNSEEEEEEEEEQEEEEEEEEKEKFFNDNNANIMLSRNVVT